MKANLIRTVAVALAMALGANAYAAGGAEKPVDQRRAEEREAGGRSRLSEEKVRQVFDALKKAAPQTSLTAEDMNRSLLVNDEADGGKQSTNLVNVGGVLSVLISGKGSNKFDTGRLNVLSIETAVAMVELAVRLSKGEVEPTHEMQALNKLAAIVAEALVAGGLYDAPNFSVVADMINRAVTAGKDPKANAKTIAEASMGGRVEEVRLCARAKVGQAAKAIQN